MEEELKSAVKVTACATASMVYARLASSKIRPGRRRLLALLPVLCLLPALPWSFSTTHLRGISAFFLAWLAVFKLLLLSAGLGPLSPSLPPLTFIATASLPVKLRPPNTPPPTHRLLSSAVKALLLAAIIPIYRLRPRMHPYVLLATYCLHMYLALEFVLASAAFLVGALLGLDLEPQFNAPYRAASLSDFWGRRWNLMVTGILRPTVYVPVRARWGPAAGVMATFLVSGLMHEVMFHYLTLAWPTGEVTAFFILHGVCVAAEAVARRAGWRPPHTAVAVPMTLGFVVLTGFWLFFPPIVRSGADEIVVEECAAVMGFLEAGGRALLVRLISLSNRVQPVTLFHFYP